MDKHTARQNTIRLYANRIMGKMLQYPIEVNDSFDCKGVADSVALPRDDSLAAHQICWKALFNKFDMEWAVF